MRKGSEKHCMDGEMENYYWINGDIRSFKTKTAARTGLNFYQQQLDAARKLARVRARTRMRAGLDARDPAPSTEKRDAQVRTIAKEFMQMLVFTGISPQHLKEAQEELNRVTGKEYELVFPPNANMCVYVHEDGVKRKLSETEQMLVARKLEQITREKVENSISTPATREGIYC